MDERRRFQLALAGIGVCLAIAGLFVVSGPPLIPPPVASPSDPGIAARTPVADVLPVAWVVLHRATARPQLKRRPRYHHG